ncbi:FAD-linked oxidase [Streptomyces globosus]|uniref:FAD-linked oxidase n=1 Tax=Streptomyces globosus TaxID=68209 RepID=A0A344TZJ6_9ACTN|nr:FAD-binding protein [Streptomyces globosus]AXE24067.1 FAD-linked oxidase [Streptomyces globosus]
MTALPPGAAVPPPELRGVLSTRESDLAAAASDFGNLVHLRPLAVLFPADAGDVAAIVRYGRANGLPVVPRGAGHAVDGQAQAPGGIVVDLTSVARVRAPDDRNLISVDAGATWQAVAEATLPRGLVPPVLPDHLGLTVGGTLAAGGFGGSSHRHGSVSDQVHELDVVTPGGELRTCSPTRDRDLFDAVRGTQGQYGIITRAALGLHPAGRTAIRHRIGCPDPGTLLAAQVRLAAGGRFDHILGSAVHVPGRGWQFVLEAVAVFTPPQAPPPQPGIRPSDGPAPETDVLPYADYLGRLAPFERQLRAAGSWQNHPHPRCNVLLPGRHAAGIIADTLAGLGPEDIGESGSVLIYPVPNRRLRAPRLPKARGTTSVLFGLQRTAPPDDPAALRRMHEGNARLLARALRVGGAAYSARTPYHDTRITGGTAGMAEPLGPPAHEPVSP